MDSPIPIIDLATSTPQSLSADLKAAVSSVGFLHLTNTGISREEINAAFGVSKEFFELSEEEKGKYPSDFRNGYAKLKASRLGETKGTGDLKENFTYGRYRAPLTETAQPLPPVFVKNQKAIQALHDKLYQVTLTVLEGCALALNLPSDFFKTRHSAGACGLSFINYPEVSKEDAASAKESARASSHKDWGSITLLMQQEDGAPGLEIFLPDAAVEASKEGKPYKLMSEIDQPGKWFQAPIVPGSILVNLGLALESWTRGLFVATLHRVVSHPSPSGGFLPRKSLVYFVQPSDETVLNPINEDGTIVQDSHAITSGEFFEQRMRSTIKAVAA